MIAAHRYVLWQRCTDSTDVLVQSIEAIFNRIAAEVAKAIGVVRILTVIIHPHHELTIY